MRDIPSNSRNKRVSNSRQRKQQHLLDVKLRECKERSRRVRTIAGGIFKMIIFGSIIAGGWLGGKEALRRFLWENPDYFVHIEDVRVHTNGTLTREQAITASSIVESQNLFRVDLAGVRAAIEKLPQVETAEVQRLLPNHIAISITERRPVAWVREKGDTSPAATENSLLIDARGNVMRSRTILPEYYHFPTISGVPDGNLAPGQRVNTFEMQSALELVRLNADSTRFQVRNIDLAKGYCLLVTDQRRAHITFGLDHLDTQLTRLNRLLDVIEPTHKEIQTVNLFVERNVPVTFYDPNADPNAVVDENGPPKPDVKDARDVKDIKKGAAGTTGKPAVPNAPKPAATPLPAAKKPARTPAKSPSSTPVTKPFHF